MRASAMPVKPVMKVLVILVLTGGFFIGYNRFLVDYSLEDLKFALNRIERKELAGLDKLLSFSAVAEAAEAAIASDRLASIEYIKDVAALNRKDRPITDVRDLMRQLISKKKASRPAALNGLDTLSDGVAGAFGIKPKLDERLAANQKKASAILDVRGSLASKLASAVSPEEKQDLLYKMGIVYMKALNYPQAISSFREAFTLDPKSRLGVRSLFNVAWCEKAMNDLEASSRDFEDLLKKNPDADVAKDAEFQSAMLARKGRKYKDAAEILERLADKYEYSALAPVALYQAAGTYSCDLGDAESAKRVLEKVRDRFVATELASSETALYKNLHPEAAKRGKEGLVSQILWRTSPLGKAVEQVIDTASTRFVIKMIEGAIKYIDLYHFDLGNNIRIERTDEFLTNWCNKYLDTMSRDLTARVSNITLRFREGSRIEMRGFGTMAGISAEGYMIGKMELKPYRPDLTPSGAFTQEVVAPNWIVYTVEECRIGPVTIPADIVNNALARCHKIFNQKMPFEVRGFHIDLNSGVGVWEGPQRFPTSQLLKEQPDMYERTYKSR